MLRYLLAIFYFISTILNYLDSFNMVMNIIIVLQKTLIIRINIMPELFSFTWLWSHHLLLPDPNHYLALTNHPDNYIVNYQPPRHPFILFLPIFRKCFTIFIINIFFPFSFTINIIIKIFLIFSKRISTIYDMTRKFTPCFIKGGTILKNFFLFLIVKFKLS